ncbi:MAG: hypothetical protein [Cressdnaviricota sp.]|nr:MAG: hypothetical protein [Cressdnaviricota sp.]
MPRFARRRLRLRRRRPTFRRRFGRRRISRKKLRLRRSRRKQRAKSFFYGYSSANHLDSPAGEITVVAPEPDSVALAHGLFSWRDTQEIFEQIRTVDDLIYPAQGTSLTAKQRRVNLRARIKGSQLLQIANGNAAGAVWLEVYICKPRHGIANAGIGNLSDTQAAKVINNNRASAFQNDFADGTLLTLGTTPFPINNANPQTIPTVNSTNFVFTPYMCPPFTENWKVVKQHKFIIPPGGQAMVKLATRWLNVTRQDYQVYGAGTGTTAGTYGLFRPRYGMEVFFRMHGQPVHSAGEQTGYGKAVLDVVSIKKYWYSHSARPLPSYRLDANTGQGVPTDAELPSGALNPVGDS